MYPVGNGYFIWLLERCENGDFARAAKRAKESGLEWVSIKIADGNYPNNISKSNSGQKDLVGPAVDAFRTAGISVWGWHYVYGYDPVGEAAIAEQRVKQFALDGYMIDAEAEYKNKPTQAKLFMKNLRSRLPGVPLGICSYRFPYYHMEFPWSAFASCDFNMPQVYWAGSKVPGYQLRTSYSQFKSLGYSMPFFPLGAAYTEFGWKPTVAEIAEFRSTVKDLRLPGYGWWEWYEATVRCPEFWDATTDKSSTVSSIFLPLQINGAPPPEAEPVLYRVMTKFPDLRIRLGPGTTFEVFGFMDNTRVYEIVEERSTVSGLWGRIAGSKPLWVCLSFTFKV